MSGLGIHWAQPGLLWVVVAWALVALVVVALDRRGAGALDRLVSSALQSALVARPARWRRVTRLALLVVSGFTMAAALLQPQMGERYVATPRVGAEIMIALDVSRSMLADDAAPSRLERAKAEVRDLLAYLRDDHVGLIAFAGRASVLSPMTPDKSFLRLALDGAGPHSVPRGGTKLAEAIGRAVTGFGDPGPSQRALILITDGEDHDSFVLDAAKRAAEAGIKIIAIGFGDEGGSPIFVRDPETGAREQIREADGRPVQSRLNGDLLRELALATDGAYVPAGTGVLDLASIYDAHIVGLTRGEIDERGRTIRDEAYQLFVAIAFVTLLAGVLLVGGRPQRGGPAASILAAFLLTTTSTPEALAQAREPDAVVEEAAPALVETPELDPRARFNRANAALAGGDPAAAAVGLRDARRDAPDDPALRYAATYNLGMAAVARADSKEDPQASLAALHEAADWFREAVALRPDEEDPRHNLEVVLRRALILADELAQAQEGDLETALDAMIERQRGQLGASAELLGAVAGREGLDEEAALAQLRPAFASAATDQRVLRAEADALAERVVREREAILRMAEDVRAPEDTLRAAQLEGVLVYLDASIERMGGTRRQLRLRRPERAYRRGAAALGELKRSRDQLRDPVEQIDVLIQETGEVLQKTGAILSATGTLAAGAEAPALPAFLTPGALEEDVRRLTDRVGELAGRLQVAAEQAAQADPPSAAPPGTPDPAALREALAGAAPFVREAAEDLERATTELGAEALREAFSSEAQAGRALADAQEFFFDLARLLEVAAEDQARIAELALTEEESVAQVRDEYAPMASALQSKNLERTARLGTLLGRERENTLAAAAQVGAPGSNEDAEESAANEKARFDAADALLAAAEGEMEAAGLGFAANALDWSGSGAHAATARDHLEQLRMLFFSLIEHLQALAREQVDLADETNQTAALAASEEDPQATADRAAALGAEQGGLETRAGAIADVLLEQSEATAPEGADPQRAEDAQARTRQAAEHVASAQLAMREAKAGLEAEAPTFGTVVPAQTVAIEELMKALELLAPPPPPEDPQGEDQNEQEESDSEGGEEREQPQGGDEGQGSRENGAAEAEEGPEDPGQLLQGVRDREAERRRDREREAERRRSQPVDRDW